MDISIVVPVHNSAAYLVRCIEALEFQDYPRNKYEIIMVDNNSTDDSYSIIKNYPSIKLLRETKQGSYAARNRGLSEAVGSIVAFTDSDCVPKTNWLCTIVCKMNEPGVGIVLGLTLPANDSRLLAMDEAYRNHMMEYIFRSRIEELYYGYTSNMAVRRELLDRQKPFIERRRGADTIFIRQSVERYSCDILRYCSKMQVRHLEINSIVGLYGKMFTYGRSRRLCSHIAYVRSLSMSESLAIFRNTKKLEGYSVPQSAILLILLAGGWFFSRMGEFSAKLA